MSEFYLQCSEELAVRLGARPAKQVMNIRMISSLEQALYDIPDNCIEIDVGDRPLIWPLIDDETRHDQCT